MWLNKFYLCFSWYMVMSQVGNAFKAQPRMHNDLTSVMSHFLNIIRTMHQRCSSSIEVLLSRQQYSKMAVPNVLSSCFCWLFYGSVYWLLFHVFIFYNLGNMLINIKSIWCSRKFLVFSISMFIWVCLFCMWRMVFMFRSLYVIVLKTWKAFSW